MNSDKVHYSWLTLNKEVIQGYFIFQQNLIMSQPDCLSRLVLESLGSYVCKLCLQLLKLTVETGAKDELEHLQQACRHLQAILHVDVPPSIANEVTDYLIKCVNDLYYNMPKAERKLWCVEILHVLVSAIVHPEVTTIKLSEDPLHILPKETYINFIEPLIYDRLHTLKKLRVLQLGRRHTCDWNVRSINLTQDLQEFTFMTNCNDNVLKELAECCKHLKCLNVNSSTRVTDASIDAILKFQHLEELKIVGTMISESGVTQLLNGLSENSLSRNVEPEKFRPLLRFGCSHITSYQLDILVDKFPDLIEVSLSDELEPRKQCDLSPLKQLRYLRVCSFRYMQCSGIQDLLHVRGCHLVYLDLCVSEPIDLKYVIENCPSLCCLHMISFPNYSPSSDNYNASHLMGFLSVRCLRIISTGDWAEYVLSHCINVRKVYLSLSRANEQELLRRVLSRNRMRFLEQLYWVPTSSEAEPMAKELADTCPNLAVIVGLCRTNTKYRGVKFLKEACGVGMLDMHDPSLL
jgi:hypothetical protein